MAQQMSRFVQYLYFLRFSIFPWFLLPVLAYLDCKGITTSFTRGIFALESAWQAFWTAFFIVATGMVILITTRVVVVNGQDRFRKCPPSWLQGLFGNVSQGRTWWALALAQSSGLGVLIYVGATSVDEVGMTWPTFLWSSGLGIVAAVAFWLVVSVFYSWTYSATAYQGLGVARTTPGAMPLIFPPRWFAALEQPPPPWFARYFAWLRLRSRFSYPGYAPSKGAPFWELHYFSIVAVWGFILLYLLLLPISAPVTLPWEMDFLLLFGVLPAAALLAGTILTPSRQTTARATRATVLAKAVFIVITSGVILSWFACIIWPSLMPRAERGMPTLASVLVLSILLTWVLSGCAFFFDRFRVPVLTTVLLVVFLPKLLRLSTGEHYYPALTVASANPAAPFPDEVLKLRTKDSGPLVIITATGGGIHAAGWTAEILSDLEKEFSTNQELKKRGYTLHDHVLLASGVSGGSVGLAQYLREYTSQPPFYSRSKVVNAEPVDDIRARMTGAANCSSLEAVAWGFEYYDFANLLFTVFPPASGTEFDQQRGPLGYDRSWALERAISRNQTDGHCQTTNGLDKVPNLQTALNMTLAQSVERLREGTLPAFTLNTTAAETGDRFLLANYQVPPTLAQNYDVLPAESFLHVYGEADRGGSEAATHPYADISVATAARLSATFPYVSSAARIPAEFAPYAFHFVDGGYFDNDGTSSVIEFLMHAFGKGPWLESEQPASQSTGRVADNRGTGRVPILLIEIRDSWDLNAANNDDSYQRQRGHMPNSPWRALQQLETPPEALWAAGHTSVTRRNRRELCLLETAYADKLSIHHVVFDYENPEGEYQPLNWHLTKNQMQLIRVLAGSQELANAPEDEWTKQARKTAEQIQGKLKEAAEWTTRMAQSGGLNDQGKDSVCAVVLPKPK